MIGGNGSGKSTLLSWMASGRPPTVAAGDVQSSPASSGRSEPLPPVEGREPMSASGSVTVAGRIGYVPQSLPAPDQPGATAALWRAGVGEAGKGLLHPRHWSRPIGELSEGNRRRVQFALAIAADPEVLIVDEPTRGIDVGTKSEVHRLISTLATRGVAVIMISSELPEVLGMADRVLVMCEGRITGEFTREEATADAIMTAATDHEKAAS